MGKGIQTGTDPVGGVSESGGGERKAVLPALSAPVPGLPLRGDHPPAGAVRCAHLLLWPSPRGQPPFGRGGGAGYCGLSAGGGGLCRIPSEKNFRLGKKTVEIFAPIW